VRQPIPNKRCRRCKWRMDDNTFSVFFCWRHRKPFDGDLCRLRGIKGGADVAEIGQHSRQDEAGRAFSGEAAQDRGAGEIEREGTISQAQATPTITPAPPALPGQLSLFGKED